MTATETFAAHRGLLVGVAYRVLGRVADAEDVVQEAWLRWSGVDHEGVDDPRGYLVTVVTRLAIDRLRQVQARRETYVGEWLPEPWETEDLESDAAADVERRESVSLAMLMVLETLSPLERVVFVLREAFHYPYAEIAEIVERTEPAVRQLASRAREHVEARRPRFDSDQEVRRRATERFVAAAGGGDVEALLRLLAPEVALHSDGGGRAKAPMRTIVGVDKVARFLVAIGADPPYDDLRMHLADVNGGPAIVATSGGEPVTVFAVDVADGLISTVYLLANPDKLGGVRGTPPA